MRLCSATSDVAVAERVYCIFAPGEEMVAAAAGADIGRDWRGDCLYTHLYSRPVPVSFSLTNAAPSWNLRFLSRFCGRAAS